MLVVGFLLLLQDPDARTKEDVDFLRRQLGGRLVERILLVISHSLPGHRQIRMVFVLC